MGQNFAVGSRRFGLAALTPIRSGMAAVREA